jgi:8-hydroxy-5-deazaflavin:NADPH oxidoreductase
MTTIAVIGAGHIGRNFSLAAIANGYEIVIANNSGPETIADLVEELGPRATAATVADAADAGAFALLAIPLTSARSVPACNYFAKRDGPIAEIDSGEQTVPQYIQAHLATSKVVRAFNHLDAASIVSDGEPEGTPNRRALGYAGDDEAAKTLAADLYNKFGFDPVDVGGLAEAWRLDVDQPTFVVRQNADELRANLAKAQRHLS